MLAPATPTSTTSCGYRGIEVADAACEKTAPMLNERTHAQVAQLVEQRTENPCVDSSTLSLGTTVDTWLFPVVSWLALKEKTWHAKLQFSFWPLVSS